MRHSPPDPGHEPTAPSLPRGERARVLVGVPPSQDRWHHYWMHFWFGLFFGAGIGALVGYQFADWHWINKGWPIAGTTTICAFSVAGLCGRWGDNAWRVILRGVFEILGAL